MSVLNIDKNILEGDYYVYLHSEAFVNKILDFYIKEYNETQVSCTFYGYFGKRHPLSLFDDTDTPEGFAEWLEDNKYIQKRLGSECWLLTKLKVILEEMIINTDNDKRTFLEQQYYQGGHTNKFAY